MYEINIRPVLNGWICQVGGQTVVFDDRHKMPVDLDAYLQRPEEVTKAYLSGSVNRHLTHPAVPAPPNLGGVGQLVSATPQRDTSAAEFNARRA